MAVFKNKFGGKCNNPACKIQVAEGEGYTQKVNNRYVVWCKQCVPERIQSAEVRRILTVDGKIISPYEPQNVPLIKSLPGPGGKGGARWDKDNRWWEVSLEMDDRRRVLEVADRMGLEVPPSLREITVTEEAQNANNAGLYPFQVEGVNFLAHKERAILGDEMGLGKSVQSLMSAPIDGKVLIICRAGLKYNWRDEVQKWRPDLRPVVLNGHGSFRWPNPGEAVIINNDILPSEFHTPEKNKVEQMQAYWDRLKVYRTGLANNHPGRQGVTLIVDEAHDYKNRKASRTRKVKEFVRLVKKAYGLTGSPISNRPEDLYAILDVMGVANEVFGSYERFEMLFNASKEHIRGRRGRGIVKTVWGKPDPIVPELLRRVMLRRLRAEVLPDLPPKTYTNLVVGEINDRLKKQLDDLWEEYGDFIQIEGELPPFEKFSEVRELLARSRVDAMLEYIDNAEEQDVPLVVFSAHLAPLDALLGRPGWAVITGATKPEKRQEIVRAFQAGQLKGVGVSIRAGGVGINLTHAWKGLFVDLEWTPAANWQAEDRLARIGQLSNKVEIIRMVSDHPLDLHILNLLADKIDTIQKAIDGSIKAHKVETKPGTPGETEEQFQARMERVLLQQQQVAQEREAQAEANRKATGKAKAGLIHQKEKAKATRTILPLTPDRIVAVKKAFEYMLSVCDGAFARDGQGFNKPDASLARYLVWAGLETPTEQEAAYMMLARYYRQLHGDYPILFKMDAKDQALLTQ